MRIPEPAWIQGDDVARGLVAEPPDEWLPARHEEILSGLDGLSIEVLSALDEASGELEPDFGSDAHWYAPDRIEPLLADARAAVRLAERAFRELRKKANELERDGVRWDDE
jgi:hypothetical protein